MSEENGAGNALKIAGAVILPNLGGLLGGYVTRKNLKNWYANLNFPTFRPPNWVFAPMWTSLYAGMGYASYLVWRDGGGFHGDAQLPLVAYGTQLALNWAWTPIFFGNHNIKGGLIEIIALTAAAGACGAMFYRVNKTAGLIFVPYMAWLGFATALNYAMWKLNPKPEKAEQKPEHSS
ncbi:translocator protein [Drosophila grimshawi]|uniref:GH11232 n=1 Tax=Drosophila grimshawi TaxID=7222 RepID=B4JDR1_DROGR|nr:translocator protein [Drosophila grimshawi]EDW03431.1 GH11232 [Drosophila grimshawi]EDW04904.1 GH23831 [Drosophila grimshawi]